mmetsp:Transcript_14538/g.47377  ORF Transcript_14538/g.47377 Transcript_14538/m.47377 type:complete len:229 (+) Transcript_14538:102-788(+)
MSFKQEHPLDRRKSEADRIRAKYPDRIPVGRCQTVRPSLFVVTGDLREGGPERHPRHRQEEVPRPGGPDGGPVHLRHPEAHQAPPRAGHLHFRRQRDTPHRRPHVHCLRSPEGRGRLPLHHLLRRKHLRPQLEDPPARLQRRTRPLALSSSLLSPKKEKTTTTTTRSLLPLRPRSSDTPSLYPPPSSSSSSSSSSDAMAPTTAPRSERLMLDLEILRYFRLPTTARRR